MAISFVGVSSQGSRNLSGNFTLLKPSGVVSGDFLVGVVAWWPGSDNSEYAITPPAGWTVSNGDFSYASGTGSTQLIVMVRTAGDSEPSSWNGSLSGTEDVEVAMVAAYRGCSGIVVSTTDVRGQATSYTVGSVTNPSSSNWRLTIGAYVSGSKNYAISSSESTLRRRDGFYSSTSGGAVEAGIWDSNGTVSSGSHSRTISRSAVWQSSVGYIAILSAASTAIPGTLEVTMPLPTMTAAASLGYAGVLDVDTPLPTMTASGIASPPSGTLDVVVMPTMTVAAAHHASGTLTVVPTPEVNVVGETRRFGIRVVTPEAESRVTTPRLGAVD